jgi:exopolysaccharide production protein ExoZ
MKTLKTYFSSKFELARGSASNSKSMEGMRGFAVALVFLVHYCTLGTPYVVHSGLMSAVLMIHQIGNFGVDLFFLLSGYLIYRAVIKGTTSYGVFLRRRVRRIYPTFFAVFLIYLLLSFAMPHESKIPLGSGDAGLYILANALLLPGIFPIDPIITVAWSLSYEAAFYLLIPMLVSTLILKGKKPGYRRVLFIGIAGAGFLLSARFGGPVRSLMFVAGILLYETSDMMRSPRGSLVPMVALAGAAAVMTLEGANSASAAVQSAVLFVTLLSFCFAVFRSPESLVARALCWTPLRWLGNMSYSYYLLHGLIVKAAFLVARRFLVVTGFNEAAFLTLVVPTFLITVLGSALLFLFIERPLSLKPRSRTSTVRPMGASGLSESADLGR